MTSLASIISINYQNYRMIMPDYSGKFFLMLIHGEVEMGDTCKEEISRTSPKM